MNFAQTLKRLRESKKIRQNILAGKLGYSPNSLSNWEAGLREPDFNTLCALAEYFGVTTDQLLGREPLQNTDKESEVREVDNNSAIKFRHGFYTDQEIEIAEKLVETLRQFPINYSSATSILDLANKLLGEAVSINLKDKQTDFYPDVDSTIFRLQQFLTEERKRDHLHT